MLSTYDQEITRACVMYLTDWSYDWRLLKAQYWQESRLNPLARSPAGAEGIAQFMPGTWDEQAPKCGYEGEPRTNPIASIYCGAAYMNNLMVQWHWERPALDRIALALASYNAGLGNILEAQKKAGYPSLYADIIPTLADITGDKNAKETSSYVKKILGFWASQVTG